MAEGRAPANRKRIDRSKKDFPVHHLCRVLGVSQNDYFAWKDHSASQRQRDDMVMLAHVRSAFALSNGTYGSPRMTRALRDNGFAIRRRRVARLTRENGLRVRQKRRLKGRRTANTLGQSRRTSSTRILPRPRPTRSGVPISRTSGRGKDGSIWPCLSTCSPAASSVELFATGCTATWHLGRAVQLWRKTGYPGRAQFCSGMADGLGFEPREGLHPRRFSRPLP